MAIKYDANTTAIKDILWPLVKTSMDKPTSKNNYKKLINTFVSDRNNDLFDSVPCSRIVCSETEMDKLFDIVNIPKTKVIDIINQTYYGNIQNFTPLSAKHPFTIVMMVMIRYFIINKMDKECELAMIHLSFSGKFYPSLHYRSYPYVPARHVMEYVVNNRLTNKYDLITQGSVFGAVKSIGKTWMDTYKDKFKSFSDEDVIYLIQQLYSRIGSFIKNVATEFYEVNDNKDLYITYSSDSLDEDDFHLADSDTLRISKITEKTMNAINANGVDYRVCKQCSTSDITPNECKAVIESIITNRNNVSTIKEAISLMVSLYFSTGEIDVANIKFITYTIAPKPNAKQKEIVRLKEIIENWLCESGTAYMRRRSRIATKNAYERAVRLYFALVIHNTNR